MENITPVSTIAFKVHVVMTLVFQKNVTSNFYIDTKFVLLERRRFRLLSIVFD